MTVQMFCVPHAGGTASAFRRWNDQIGDGLAVIPLELAGRGPRANDPFSPDVPAAVTDLIDQLTSKRDGSLFVLFGHCMGAVIAFEMARRLRGADDEPVLLVVSGRNPPHLPNEWSRKVAPLSDDELFTELVAVGGVPKGLSRAMARAFLPIFRADQAMVRGYDAGGPEPRISQPVLALAGDDDFMTSDSLLPGWADYTERSVTVCKLPGNHYFVYNWVAEVGQFIREQLLDVEVTR
ncbi:thioesterase II family protein [Actinoallomurus rhizosphaericola]|uniref:thioesterase II family protein n=1 Tax=Actinoallomurus rhizosphaericola TaxID=2952536 RepID=UPI002090AABC|nr:alpha/beta fold hydrolase [Actinoallomurus rhizosphaericola]MCO5994304.1 alpha/beta fold hydrolase [Actinoallomurus rhizosphaericola]